MHPAAITNEDPRVVLGARGNVREGSPAWKRPRHLRDLQEVIIRYSHGRPESVRSLSQCSRETFDQVRSSVQRQLDQAPPPERRRIELRMRDYDLLVEAALLGMLDEQIDEICRQWRQGVWMRVNEGVVFGELREGELVDMTWTQEDFYDPPVGTQAGTYYKTARRHLLPDGSSVPIWRYGRCDSPCPNPCGPEMTCSGCGTGDYLAFEHALEQQEQHRQQTPSPYPLRVGQRVRVLPADSGGEEFDATVVDIHDPAGANQSVTVASATGALQGRRQRRFARQVKALEP